VTLTSYLLLGMATSLHCVAMCGGLVLTYAVRDETRGTLMSRLAPHLAYQGSKVLSYAAVALALGGLAAAVGGMSTIESVRNWILLIAGVYLIGLGLSMTGRFAWLRWLSPRPPRFLVRLLSENRRRARSNRESGTVDLATPIVFGLLTGLMPCAPLIAAQIGAMSAGSPLRGAELMVAFGIGTAPLLIVFGLASGFASRALRQRMQYVATAAVIVFGLVLFDRGLMLVGSPVTFDSARRAITGAGSAQTVRGWRVQGGVATFDLVIADTHFVPDTVTLPSGRPGRIIVDRREAVACSDQLAIPQLGVLADLTPNGITVVEVPARPAGSYTLTCGMGMMAGTLVLEK
jgi:sulfite exporter TauE/SafE